MRLGQSSSLVGTSEWRYSHPNDTELRFESIRLDLRTYVTVLRIVDVGVDPALYIRIKDVSQSHLRVLTSKIIVKRFGSVFGSFSKLLNSISKNLQSASHQHHRHLQSPSSNERTHVGIWPK